MRPGAFSLLLLTALALIFTSPLSYAQVSWIVTVSPLHNFWQCIPDLELQLDPDTLHEAAISTKSDAAMKVLDHIGISFIVNLDNPVQMQCLLDVLLFGNLQKGVCPSPYSSSLYSLLQISFPVELRQRYGVQRLKSLEHIALPDVWNAIENTSVVASTLNAVEEVIAAMPNVNPPGMIVIKLPATVAGDVHPQTFSIPLADISVTAGPSINSWWVHFDYTATYKRLLWQKRIQAKRHYNATLDRSSKGPPRAPQQFEEEGASEATASGPLNSSNQPPQSPGFTCSDPFLDPRLGDPFEALEGGSLACMKLTRAWRTLREQRVLSSDSRLMQLRRLLARYRCPHEEEREENVEAGVEERDKEMCVNFCQALQETRGWGQRTGQPLTTAQSFAIFLSSFGKNLTTAAPSSGAGNWWGVRTSPRDDDFDDQGFLKRTLDFIHRQGDRLCGCDVSYAERGEFVYLAALLQLLQPPGRPNTTSLRAHTTEEYNNPPSPRVVVDFYQAMWYESPHAIAALATLREHGILTRQHHKAALSLLLRSMRGKSAFLFRQLFLQQRRRSDAAAEKMNSSLGFNRTSPAELLLRQERFYAVLNGFGNLNYPVISRKSIDSILSMDDQQPYDPEGLRPINDAEDILSEEENLEVASGREVGRLSAQAANQLTKASILLAGPMDVKQDLRRVECELLTILRMFGYLCDVELLDSMELNEEATSTKYHRARLYRGICMEHTLALGDLLSSPGRLRISCPTWLRMKREAATESVTLPIPRMKKNFLTLQQTLMLLSYLYLLEKQEYELVSAYASLSVDLSAAAHKVAYADLRPKVLHELAKLSKLHQETSDGGRANTESGGLQFDSKNLYRHLKNWGEKRLAKVAGTKLPYDAFQSKASPLALVDSPVAFIGEQMTLLAACALLDQTVKPRKLNSLSSSKVFGPAQMSASMWHINNLFYHVFRVPFSRSPQEAAFLMLLTAMNQWEHTQSSINMLDQSYLSVHTIDSFVLMTWLLNDYPKELPEYANEGKSKSLDDSSLLNRLLGLAITQYRGLVGRRRKFLPLPDDTIRFYSRRLLSFSARNVRSSESVVELLFSGLAAPVNLLDELTSRRSIFQALRNGKQRDLDRTQLLPLLYASDTDEYLSSLNWTRLERLGDRVANAFYYLFTETTEEALLRKMGIEILSPPLTFPTDDQPQSQLTLESPAEFVAAFLECFASSPRVRALSIATLLLSIALESGDPTGFALIFFEAGERHNPFMVPFADYVAHEVWDDAVMARMWWEHHAVAQWHREKARLHGYCSALSLDAHSPFRYKAVELRQELMTSVSRWRAKREIQRAMAASNSSEGRGSPRRLHNAMSILLQCTSSILHTLASGCPTNPNTSRAATNTTQNEGHTRGCRDDDRMWLENIPSTLYDSMLFPAGDPQCALELYSLLEQVHGDSFTARMRSNFMTYVVGDLVGRLTYYYNLTTSPLSKDVLPPSSAILEGDGLHSKSGLKKGKDGIYENGNKDHYGSDLEREFLVEPWNRIGAALREEMPMSLGRGEGMLYNLRLHRLSGMRWGVKAISLWSKVNNWFRRHEQNRK
ncbi:unnamed protein product [Phytomonas sp. EM1]|nr:unnamed protein product [Phytomonas sp. EM1]|eukprot:CCW59980.1 unnamed protein product [Phytomonas sp. isolate EM1]